MTRIVMHRNPSGGYGTQYANLPDLRWYRMALSSEGYNMTEDITVDGVRQTALDLPDRSQRIFEDPPAGHHWTVLSWGPRSMDYSFTRRRTGPMFEAAFFDMVWYEFPGPNWVQLPDRDFVVGDFAMESITNWDDLTDNHIRPGTREWARGATALGVVMDEPYLTASQIAEMERISRETVARMAAETAVPPAVIDPASNSSYTIDGVFAARNASWQGRGENAEPRPQRRRGRRGGPRQRRDDQRRESLEQSTSDRQDLQRAYLNRWTSNDPINARPIRDTTNRPVRNLREGTPAPPEVPQTPIQRAYRVMSELVESLSRITGIDMSQAFDSSGWFPPEGTPVAEEPPVFSEPGGTPVNPEQSVIDSIDELVDDSITSQRTMDSYQEPLKVALCELCAEQWHGAPGVGECDPYGRGLGALGCPGAYATDEGLSKWLSEKAAEYQPVASVDQSCNCSWCQARARRSTSEIRDRSGFTTSGGRLRVWDENYNFVAGTDLPVATPVPDGPAFIPGLDVMMESVARIGPDYAIELRGYVSDMSMLPTDLTQRERGATWFMGTTALVWGGTGWLTLEVPNTGTNPYPPLNPVSGTVIGVSNSLPWVVYLTPDDQSPNSGVVAVTIGFDGSRGVDSLLAESAPPELVGTTDAELQRVRDHYAGAELPSGAIAELPPEFVDIGFIDEHGLNPRGTE